MFVVVVCWLLCFFLFAVCRSLLVVCSLLFTVCCSMLLVVCCGLSCVVCCCLLVVVCLFGVVDWPLPDLVC